VGKRKSTHGEKTGPACQCRRTVLAYGIVRGMGIEREKEGGGSDQIRGKDRRGKKLGCQRDSVVKREEFYI